MIVSICVKQGSKTLGKIPDTDAQYVANDELISPIFSINKTIDFYNWLQYDCLFVCMFVSFYFYVPHEIVHSNEDVKNF